MCRYWSSRDFSCFTDAGKAGKHLIKHDRPTSPVATPAMAESRPSRRSWRESAVDESQERPTPSEWASSFWVFPLGGGVRRNASRASLSLTVILSGLSAFRFKKSPAIYSSPKGNSKLVFTRRNVRSANYSPAPS